MPYQGSRAGDDDGLNDGRQVHQETTVLGAVCAVGERGRLVGLVAAIVVLIVVGIVAVVVVVGCSR